MSDDIKIYKTNIVHFNFALIDYLLSLEKSGYAERRQYADLMHKCPANNNQFITSQIEPS